MSEDSLTRDEIEDLLDDSEFIGEDGSIREANRWAATNSNTCDHKFTTRSTAALEELPWFTKRTSASELSICTRCGYISENRR